MELTARTLILDLLTTVRRGAMPVRALVEAAEFFEFAPNNVRVSLSKLTAEGRVDRDERGRYRLAPAIAALSRQLRHWRKIEEHQRAWRGDWVAVHRSRRGRGAALARSERALALLGFRELDRGLDIRPDNLVGGVAAARERLQTMTADARSGGPEVPPIVGRLGDLDAASDERARGLWDTSSLIEGYRLWTERLDASRKRLHGLSPEAAMVETFVVGGGAVRHLHFDPLLPVQLLDPKPRQALVAAARRYDELGRLQWAPFMEKHDVPNFGARDGWRSQLGEIPEATWEGMQREP